MAGNQNSGMGSPLCVRSTFPQGLTRRTNTDKYSLNICTYKLYRYTNEDIVEKKGKKRAR